MTVSYHATAHQAIRHAESNPDCVAVEISSLDSTVYATTDQARQLAHWLHVEPALYPCFTKVVFIPGPTAQAAVAVIRNVAELERLAERYYEVENGGI